MLDRVSRILRLGSLLIYDVDQDASKYRSIGVSVRRERVTRSCSCSASRDWAWGNR